MNNQITNELQSFMKDYAADPTPRDFSIAVMVLLPEWLRFLLIIVVGVCGPIVSSVAYYKKYTNFKNKK